ncbi:hypothetical protein ZWY2020_032494 [Hordeum vulgare]|nr:hypothetical protein ZWY2020_032494 [Hordeum vulgare]
MAASLGLTSHEEACYSAHPAGSSLYNFQDGEPFGAAADGAAALSFQELVDAARPSDYAPLPAFGAAGGEAMSMYERSVVFPMTTSSYYCDGAGMFDDDAAARARGGGVGAMAGRPSGRIGFRTRSEVEVMDDGFRWRKYGKKAVKSSPNLRNYYRCSADGCGVKKRVERDRDDPRYVLTTYDGVHNHVAPGGGTPSRAAPAYSAPAAPAWTWSELHAAAAAAAHSSESY